MTDVVEVYRTRVRRQWRWRYVARNGRIIATSSEGYHNRADCITGATRALHLDGRTDVTVHILDSKET